MGPAAVAAVLMVVPAGLVVRKRAATADREGEERSLEQAAEEVLQRVADAPGAQWRTYGSAGRRPLEPGRRQGPGAPGGEEARPIHRPRDHRAVHVGQARTRSAADRPLHGAAPVRPRARREWLAARQGPDGTAPNERTARRARAAERASRTRPTRSGHWLPSPGAHRSGPDRRMPPPVRPPMRSRRCRAPRVRLQSARPRPPSGPGRVARRIDGRRRTKRFRI